MNRPSIDLFRLRLRRDDAVLWLAVGMFLVGLVGTTHGPLASIDDTMPGVLSAVPPLIVGVGIALYLLGLADPFRTRSRMPRVVPFLLGGTFVVWLAANTNTAAVKGVIGILGDDVAARWNAAILGPTTEEALKGLAILTVLLLTRDVIRRPAQGFLVGAYVGLGFEVVENISYAAHSAVDSLQGDAVGALQVTFFRSLTSVFSHWFFSGVVGAGIAIALARGGRWGARPRAVRLLLALGLLVVGWAAHFLWNSPTPGFVDPLLGVGLKYVVAIPLMIAVYVWVIRDERAWFAGAARDAGLDEQAVAALSTRKARRHDRKAAKADGGGRRAARARGREQRALIERVQEHAAVS